MNLSKKEKDFYNKNNRTLMEKIKNINKWKESLCSWIRRRNIANVNTAQSNLGIQCSPCLNLSDFLKINRKIRPIIHMESQGSLYKLKPPGERTKLENSLPMLNTYYKATSIKTAWCFPVATTAPCSRPSLRVLSTHCKRARGGPFSRPKVPAVPLWQKGPCWTPKRHEHKARGCTTSWV